MKKFILSIVVFVCCSSVFAQTHYQEYIYMKEEFNKNTRANKEHYIGNIDNRVKKTLQINGYNCLYWEYKLDGNLFCYRFNIHKGNEHEEIVIPLYNSPERVLGCFYVDLEKKSKNFKYLYFLTIGVKDMY